MQVSDQIIKILDKLCEKFGVVVDFTKDNIIPYLQQLANRVIQYEVNTSIAWIVIGILILITGIVAFKYARKYDIKEQQSQAYLGLDVYYMPLYIISIIFIIISLLIITIQTFDIIQAKTLPEKTLWEYVDYYR